MTTPKVPEAPGAAVRRGAELVAETTRALAAAATQENG